MSSRQEQLHSYRFMIQRVVAALVTRESDPPRSPLRRATGAALAGVLIAAIAVGGVAAYGAVTGAGGTRWREPGAVIVEKESGARYVYLDDRLHPVANYSSALLIAGAASPRTVLVSRASLEGVPRGVPLGIPDAPDSLPAPDRLLGGPWTVCSVAARPDDPAGGSAVRSVLLVGSSVGGGSELGDEALLARHPNGEVHLVWGDHRYRISDRKLVFAALGWTGTRPVPVAPALLNALPSGADLAPPPIPGRGERSAKIAGSRIGEVFAVTGLGGERQYAVAMRDGLAVITEVQAALLLTEHGQERPTDLSQGRFASLPRVPDLLPAVAGAPPATIPRLTSDHSGTVCAAGRGDGGVAEVRIAAAVPESPVGSATGARALGGGVLADHVIVPAGRGALVEAAAAPGATGGSICVITDLGRRYPLAGRQVLPMLGYGEVTPLRLPAALVALVPAGPVLDPETARRPPARPARA